MLKYYESGTYLLDSHSTAVMFDSGATHSFVSRTFINRLGCGIGKLARPMVIEIAGMIFIRALLICCLSVTSIRKFSCDFSDQRGDYLGYVLA